MSMDVSVLIIQPWLVLVPSAIFMVAGVLTKSKVAQAVGCAWLFYCLYEFLMKYRILCSGAASLVGVVATVYAGLKRFNVS